MKKDIEKIFEEQGWFEHIDCTEENCIFTFIKNNYDKFGCKLAHSCDYSWMCNELRAMRQEIRALAVKQERELRLFRMTIDGLLEKIDVTR